MRTFLGVAPEMHSCLLISVHGDMSSSALALSTTGRSAQLKCLDYFLELSSLGYCATAKAGVRKAGVVNISIIFPPKESIKQALRYARKWRPNTTTCEEENRIRRDRTHTHSRNCQVVCSCMFSDRLSVPLYNSNKPLCRGIDCMIFEETARAPPRSPDGHSKKRRLVGRRADCRYH